MTPKGRLHSAILLQPVQRTLDLRYRSAWKRKVDAIRKISSQSAPLLGIARYLSHLVEASSQLQICGISVAISQIGIVR
jgi:hypothetical protein